MIRPAVVLIASLALVGCANTKTPANCAPPTSDRLLEIVQSSLAGAFGKRQGGYQVILEPTTTDAAGNLVYRLTRVAPAAEKQPAPGEGRRLTVVVERCTAKVLGTNQP